MPTPTTPETKGMTSRMWYEDKDHVDIFQNGHYHTAIVCSQPYYDTEHNYHDFYDIQWEKYPKPIYSDIVACSKLGRYKTEHTSNYCLLFIDSEGNFDFKYTHSDYFNPISKVMMLGVDPNNSNKSYWVKNFENTIHEVTGNRSIIYGMNDCEGNAYYNGYSSTHPDTYGKNITCSYRRLNWSTKTFISGSGSLNPDYIYYMDQFADMTPGNTPSDCFLASVEDTSWWLGIGDVTCFDYSGNAIGPDLKLYSEGAEVVRLYVVFAKYMELTQNWLIQGSVTRTLSNSTRTFLFLCNRNLSSYVVVLNADDVTRKYFTNFWYKDGYFYFQKVTNNITLYNHKDLWRTRNFVDVEWVSENWARKPIQSQNPNAVGEPIFLCENMKCVYINDDGDREDVGYYDFECDIQEYLTQIRYNIPENSQYTYSLQYQNIPAILIFKNFLAYNSSTDYALITDSRMLSWLRSGGE